MDMISCYCLSGCDKSDRPVMGIAAGWYWPKLIFNQSDYSPTAFRRCNFPMASLISQSELQTKSDLEQSQMVSDINELSDTHQGSCQTGINRHPLTAPRP